MDHLIIAFFEFPVNIDVLDVQDTKMHENLAAVRSPRLKIDLTLLVELEWFLLNFELFLKIIKRVL